MGSNILFGTLFSNALCTCSSFNGEYFTASPVTGRGGPQGCETSRLPHFLDNRLTDDFELVSLKRRPLPPHPPEDSWYSFLLEVESTLRP
jgi:hypothetical protein